MSAPDRAAGGATAIVAAVAVLLSWTLLAGGGDRPGRLAWIGGTAVLLVGVLAVLTLLGILPRPALARPAVVAVGALAAVGAWQALSVWWSVLPDASWDAVNRTLAYLAFLGLGIAVGAVVPRAPRLVANLLAALLGGTCVLALAGKILARLVEDYGRVARLRWPVGYWNVLALVGVLALLLGIWMASGPGGRARRACGALLAYVALVVLALTLSRGGIAVAVLAGALWLAIDRRRVESLAALFVAGVPAALVAAVAFALPGITADGQPDGVRSHDGWIFGLVLVAGAILVALVWARLAEREVRDGERRTGNRVVAGVVAAALLALVFVAAVGWNDFANPAGEQLPQTGGRLASTSSNFRWSWWEEAWRTWRDHPLRGTGAASFELSHRLLREERAQPATEPHNLAVQALSELGVVGFALLAAFVAAVVVAIRRRAREDDGAAVAVLGVCAFAYALHTLADITWDYVAATASILVAIGVLLARPGRRERTDSLWAIGAGALAATVVLSLATPALADHRLELAYAALDRAGIDDGALTRAVERTREAHSLNPLALEPLLTQAAVEESRGNEARALRLYRQAVDLQPENPEGYVELGSMELRLGNACEAYQHLNRAYTLDRYNPVISRPGGPLDVARARVNVGACER